MTNKTGYSQYSNVSTVIISHGRLMVLSKPQGTWTHYSSLPLNKSPSASYYRVDGLGDGLVDGLVDGLSF